MAPDNPAIENPEIFAQRLGWPEPDRFVDALGLLCPHPLLATRRAVDSLNSGEYLLIAATDPHARLDLEVYVRRAGHQLQHREQDDVWYFLLQVA